MHAGPVYSVGDRDVFAVETSQVVFVLEQLAVYSAAANQRPLTRQSNRFVCLHRAGTNNPCSLQRKKASELALGDDIGKSGIRTYRVIAK
jgi:hypothetical protein